MAEFKVVDCCINCIHRRDRIGANVVCKLHNKWISDRLICSDYNKTDNKRVINSETKLEDYYNGKE